MTMKPLPLPRGALSGASRTGLPHTAPVRGSVCPPNDAAAEMPIQLQAARLLTYWSASQMDAGKRADTETGVPKVFASETAPQCALDSLRVHGGYGYSQELKIERLYRDAPLMAIGKGTSDVLPTVIAKSLFAGRATIC